MVATLACKTDREKVWWTAYNLQDLMKLRIILINNNCSSNNLVLISNKDLMIKCYNSSKYPNNYD